MATTSENKMNIPIPLCNFWHLNGILKISVEIIPKFYVVGSEHFLVKIILNSNLYIISLR